MSNAELSSCVVINSEDRRERITVHSGPDSMGRWSFTLEWLSSYHPGDPRGENRTAWRGQVFHAPLPEWLPSVAFR